jgi:hypothetical protein
MKSVHEWSIDISIFDLDTTRSIFGAFSFYVLLRRSILKFRKDRTMPLDGRKLSATRRWKVGKEMERSTV